MSSKPDELHAPKLSVILCSFNGESTIGEQLTALTTQDTAEPWELIVVNNRSTDATVEVARTFEGKGVPLRVVDAKDKAGLAHARNVGVDAAAAPSVAFCDDDDIVAPGWVGAMIAALDTNEFVATAIEYDRLNGHELLVGRARFQESGLETLFGMPVVSGACGIRTETWKRLNGNDETLTSTGEDFDFALRAFRSGVEPVFAADAIYHYRLREEPEAIFAQARAYGASHAMLWARHGNGRTAPRDALEFAAREWWWILTRAPNAAVGRNRSLWLRKAGRRVGRLQGSIRDRVFVP